MANNDLSRAADAGGRDFIDIAIVTLPGFSIGELSQVADAFSLANRLGASVSFRTVVFGISEGRVASSAGIDLPCRSILSLGQSPKNLIVIGPPPADKPARTSVASVLRRFHRQGGFIAGIGEAVEMLAEVRLVSRASAHWQARQALQERFRNVEFIDDIFTRDGSVATCAGAGATADFALDLIAQFAGKSVADGSALDLKCGLRRRADRTQRKTRLARFSGAHAGFLSAIEVIRAADEQVPRVDRIAAAAGISMRQLQRLFKRYLKRTPTECLRVHRLEQAKELLTRTPMSVMEVALATGFESSTNFTRNYAKAFGVTPSETRREFRTGRG